MTTPMSAPSSSLAHASNSASRQWLSFVTRTAICWFSRSAGESDLHVESEVVAEVAEVVPKRVLRTDHISGVDGEIHPKDVVANRLIEVLDVDPALEQEAGHPGNEPGVVVSDYRDFSHVGRHRCPPPLERVSRHHDETQSTSG